MANNGELKSWDKCKFVFGFLAGGRDDYKNKLLVQGKQTVGVKRVAGPQNPGALKRKYVIELHSLMIH